MNRTLKIIFAASLLAAAGAAAGVNTLSASTMALAMSSMNTANRAASGGTIVDVAADAGSFGTLLKAATAAGLVDTLKSDGPFTIFAPTDEAFAKVNAHTLADLLKPQNKDKLRTVLLYHVVPGRVSAAQAAQLTTADTVSGQRVKLALSGGTFKADKASITATDIQASNGVIHVIDRVLMPQTGTIVDVAQKANFNTLLAAAKAAGLAEALSGPGPFTVLAPTDEAFAKLGDSMLAQLLRPENKDQLAAILKLHVISGRVYADAVLKAASAPTLNGEAVQFALQNGRLTAGGATITATDIEASNGLVHVIDRVLIPAQLRLKSDPGALPAMLSGDVATPAQMIEMAIERGVPLFNRGDQDACAAIYEVTARAVLAMPAGSTPPEARSALQMGLSKAMQAKDDAARAWALREAMDQALAMVQASKTGR